MKALLKFVPPILFALFGAVAFAWIIGPEFLTPIVLVVSLGFLGAITLIAIPSLFGPFCADDVERDRSTSVVWLACFWFVPVVGYVLILPVSQATVVVARSFPMAVQSELSMYFATNGRYPDSPAEVAFWDVRRHLVHYETDGTSYSFWYSDPERHLITHSLSSSNPVWTEFRDHRD